jgi:hypothetical protein
MRRMEALLYLAAQNFILFSKIQDQNLKKNQKDKILQRLMSFPRPIQWYYSHVDIICPDSTVPYL